jgi:hypothetical protein
MAGDFLDNDLDILGDDDAEESSEVGIDYAISDNNVGLRETGVVHTHSNPEPANGLSKILRGEIQCMIIVFKDGRKLKVLP